MCSTGPSQSCSNTRLLRTVFRDSISPSASSHTYWQVLLDGTEHNINTYEHPRTAYASTAVNNQGSWDVALPHITDVFDEKVCWGRSAMVWPFCELQVFYTVTHSCLLKRHREVYWFLILEVSFQLLIYQTTATTMMMEITQTGIQSIQSTGT